MGLPESNRLYENKQENSKTTICHLQPHQSPPVPTNTTVIPIHHLIGKASSEKLTNRGMPCESIPGTGKPMRTLASVVTGNIWQNANSGHFLWKYSLIALLATWSFILEIKTLSANWSCILECYRHYSASVHLIHQQFQKAF